MRPAYPFEAVGASIALDSGGISVGVTDPRPAHEPLQLWVYLGPCFANQ